MGRPSVNLIDFMIQFRLVFINGRVGLLQRGLDEQSVFARWGVIVFKRGFDHFVGKAGDAAFVGVSGGWNVGG